MTVTGMGAYALSRISSHTRLRPEVAAPGNDTAAVPRQILCLGRTVNAELAERSHTCTYGHAKGEQSLNCAGCISTDLQHGRAHEVHELVSQVALPRGQGCHGSDVKLDLTITNMKMQGNYISEWKTCFNQSCKRAAMELEDASM